MKMMPVSAAVAAGLLMLGGCAQEEQVATETPVTPEPEPGPVSAQVWVDDFSIGTELTPTDEIAAPDSDIQPGESLYIAMDVADAPADTTVTVQWFGPDGNQLSYETKTVAAGQENLTFVQDNTADWEQGDYRAEVWVGDEKVNEQEFQVVTG